MVFQKKPLGRRWYLMSSSAKSGAANLVPLRLERSESASDKAIPCLNREPICNKFSETSEKIYC